ncbi:MAG TPA: bi-domain-containing oxidoreductase [Pyrinomonadaceae bacterium]|jgi:polar amino acid transport system substrate-binding protein|nr:bi-domain-containing oxidoreductase [Pyrinomonadaceae bacterium]
MKQLLQNLRTGEATVAEVPVPVVQPGRVLVRTAASLISAGTERALTELGQKSLLGKARERPELIGKVWEKVKTEGVAQALEGVRDKLAQSHAVGYSAAGIVIECGDNVTEFRPGDHVACAGTDYASHAEVISVPRNLCVRVPELLSFAEAAFGTVGAIALQGVRLAEPALGESVVVIGLGLVGQLTVQLLKANGCRVFGIDIDESRVQLALASGAEAGSVPAEAREKVLAWSRGHGADACIIAAATSSHEPVELAGEISRLKGRVIAVGLVGMNVPRNVYYQRELTLKVSMSYGPGRHDPDYEERGNDYPIAYVRWTEGRNIEAFIDLLATGRIDVKPLITHRFAIAEAAQAYQLISGKSQQNYLAVMLEYDSENEVNRRIENRAATNKAGPAGRVGVGLIGAGGYAQKVLLPNFKVAGVEFCSIASASGVSARDVGTKFGFARFLSDAKSVVDDPEANLIVIATRHGSHAELTKLALAAGKHVFVEKPLALNDAELDAVLAAAANSEGQLLVGFNRRFSPLAVKAKEFFVNRQSPLSLVYRVNAGRIPREHWTQDTNEGGGRIVGEVCHFVDLMQFLTGAPPQKVYAESVAGGQGNVSEDSVFITLQFADGSNGVIAYLAEGDSSLPKEHIEIFGEGKTFVIEDFRSAKLYAGGREKKETLRQQDKGQREQARVACAVVSEGRPAPISLQELEVATRTTFRIRDSLRTGQPKTVSMNDE